MADIKVGDRVRLPILEQAEHEPNREFNIYLVAGQNQQGWIWLSIDKFEIEEECEVGIVKSWQSGGDYDGYNGDIILDRQSDGLYDLRMADERCALQFHRGPFEVALVEAGPEKPARW